MAGYLPRTSEATLFGIPAEIRVQIFGYLFTGSTITVGMAEEDEQVDDTKITGGQMAWNILRVCKLFKQEAGTLPRLPHLVLNDLALSPGVGNIPRSYLGRVRTVKMSAFGLRHTNPMLWGSAMTSLTDVEVLSQQFYFDLNWANASHLSPIIDGVGLFVRGDARRLIQDMFEGSAFATATMSAANLRAVFDHQAELLGLTIRYVFEYAPRENALVGAPAGLRGLPKFTFTMDQRGRVLRREVRWVALRVYTPIM